MCPMTFMKSTVVQVDIANYDGTTKNIHIYAILYYLDCALNRSILNSFFEFKICNIYNRYIGIPYRYIYKQEFLKYY